MKLSTDWICKMELAIKKLNAAISYLKDNGTTEQKILSKCIDYHMYDIRYNMKFLEKTK